MLPQSSDAVQCLSSLLLSVQDHGMIKFTSTASCEVWRNHYKHNIIQHIFVPQENIKLLHHIKT